MSRTNRQVSFMGYYHVIVRGVGKQILFENDRDCGYFLAQLEKYSSETGVSVCAYCLMENHVHLLVHDSHEALSLFMKKLGVSYATYYNLKYDRTGHLFQDRFQSEPVETEPYLLTVFRYILNNPVKAGICPASEYRWSSYHSYADSMSFVNTDIFLQLIGNWDRYTAFIDQENDDECMECFPQKKDDEWAKAALHRTLGLQSGSEIRTYPKIERDAALRKLKQAGLTIRQIERLTGISHNIIQRLK